MYRRIAPNRTGRDEAIEFLREELDHVSAFELAVHEYIEPGLFLLLNEFVDLALRCNGDTPRL